MNATSHRIQSLVHSVNAVMKAEICAYTFDAGPNAVLLVPTPFLPLLLRGLAHVFPPPNAGWVKELVQIPPDLPRHMDIGAAAFGPVYGPAIEEIILTRPGNGAMITCEPASEVFRRSG